MSVINVTVTNAGAANVAVSNGSTINATVGNGGAVNVSTGTISPGNATVVSGTLTINSTTTLSAGSQAYVKNDLGTAFAAKLDIGIPAGPATLVSVGNTTTLAAGSNATVNGTLSGNNLTLDFGIPVGANGINGVTPAFAIGNVTTGAAGSSALVVATSTNSGANVTLDLTIPRGDPGTSGSNGTNGTAITLSDGTPANLGTAAPGTSNLSARADHVHSLPIIAYASLSGVPANFPTNATLVSGLSAGYSSINHGHSYVTALNNLTGNLTLAAGSNVTVTSNGSTLTIAASGGGLGDNDAVDGGNYLGEIIGGITFSLQPQSQTVTTGAFLVSNVTMPTGSYAAISVANGTYFAVPSNTDSGGDYLAASTNGISWTRQNAAFPSPAAYNPVQFGGGLYLALQDTTDSGQKYATSSDGVTWTERTPPLVFVSVRYITGLGWVGLYTTGVYSRFQVSADGVTWVNLYDGNLFGLYRTVLDYSLIAGKFVVSTNASGYRATISNGAIGTFGGPSIDGGFIAAASESAIYANSTEGTLTVVDWNAESITLSATSFLNASHAVYHAPSGRWIVVAVSGIWTTSGTSTPALRQAFQSGVPQTSSRVHVSSGGRATAFLASGGSVGFNLWSSDDGGISWTSRQSSTTPGGTPSATGAGDLVFVLPPSIGAHTSEIRVVTPGGTTATAYFAVSSSASGGNPVSYQWQRSVDAGTNWNAVANATSAALNLTGLTTSDNGTRYRAEASATGAATVTSQSATLTVTG